MEAQDVCAVGSAAHEDRDELVLGKGLPQDVAAEGWSWVLARFGG